MIKRSANSSYFKDMHVFPGGSIDQSDINMARLQCPYKFQVYDLARRIGAVRELFEESGIMLFNGLNANISLETMQYWRKRVHSDASELEKMMSELQITLNLDKLIAWSRWITPKQIPKRFDTMFYLAEIDYDNGHLAAHLISHDGSEGVDSCWMDPQEALSSFEKQMINLAPPTYYILNELSNFAKECAHLSVYDSSFRQSSFSVMEPKIVTLNVDGEKIQAFIFPGDPLYYNSEGHSNETLYHRLEFIKPYQYKLYVPKYLHFYYQSKL